MYSLAITVTVIAALAGGPMLLRACSRLVESRHRLAASARDEERRRVTRDLHDVLGSRLSALSLSGELALRLIEHDPPAAAARAREMRRLFDVLTADIDVALHDGAVPSSAAEIASARAVLRRAGVHTDIVHGPEPLGPEYDALVAWGVREGVTNVLRHSAARHVTITVSRDAGALALEIVNDGGHVSASRGGRGLHGLAERARALGGDVTVTDRDGRFVLRVEVPTVPPTAVATVWSRSGRRPLEAP